MHTMYGGELTTSHTYVDSMFDMIMTRMHVFRCICIFSEYYFMSMQTRYIDNSIMLIRYLYPHPRFPTRRPHPFPGEATMSSTLHPPASINIPGLKRPLVGFWGVFFEIVSGGLFPASSSSTEGGGGSKGDGGSQNCSWKGGLPSELVWKALIYAVRLRFLREGWDGDFAATFSGMGRSDGGSGSSKDEGLCSGNSVREDLELAGGGPTASSNTETAVAAAEVEAANAAHRTRRKETSKALWQCVRLLLAASPFAIEFAGDDPGEASAVTATAKASAAALGRAALATSSRPGVIKVANSGHHFYGSTAAAPQASSLPLLRVAEEAFQCSTSFGMVARVLLERVLVLARVYPPEAGPRGVVEKLWEGVQRVSVSYTTLLCTGVDARGAVSASSGGVPSELVATSEGRRGGQGGRAQAGGGGQAPSKVELLRPDEKEGKRIRSARRLGRKQPALTSGDFFFFSLSFPFVQFWRVLFSKG